jgi:4-hydroxy-tetrahydrodipicolinate synthase
MASHPSSGVLAALITPVDRQGHTDLRTFEQVIEFVLERGVDGVVVGGGTAEYPHLNLDDRAALAAHAVNRINGRGKVIASIGTSSIHSTLRLAKQAAGAGCDALLIPMPYFFCYEQQDLAAFCREVCRNVAVPCFLYNLPSFTNALEVETAIDLLTTVPNLVGLKDSSGCIPNLEPLARARTNSAFALFVGDDSLLLEALRAGWDGVVSGIACFAPELIVSVYSAYRAGDLSAAASRQSQLDALIEQVVSLPIPWGVRLGLAKRGIENGPLHLPLSPGRIRQIEAFERWLDRWMNESQIK